MKSLTYSSRVAATIGVALAVIVSMFVIATRPVHADIDPANCTDNGGGISIAAFRADGVTNIGSGSVSDSEAIKYQATLSALPSPNCAFEGGTWALVTPDGVSHNLGAVSRIGGTGVPSITSALVPYTVNHADEIINSTRHINATTTYGGGISHADNGDITPGPTLGTSKISKVVHTPTVTTNIHNGSHVVITSAAVGASVHDNAVVTGESGGVLPTGNISFNLYGNTTCEGAKTTQVVALSGNIESATTTVPATGLSYMAHYNGDSNYNPADGICEPLTVTQVPKGHIIVVKDAQPNDAQNFTFTNNFGNGNPASFDLDDDADGALLNSRDSEVTPGVYAVSEGAVAGWTNISATCSDGSPIGAIDVSSGETVTCTFVNTKDTIRVCAEENCSGLTTVVDQNVTVDFSGAGDPVCSGDADLCNATVFSWSKVGTDPSQWKAIFNLGGNKLLVKNGATITTTQIGKGNNKAAPGIEIHTSCDVVVESGGSIVVESLNKQAGDITVNASHITVDGTIRNEVKGTNGMPGKINLNSSCGYTQSTTGLVEVLGVDPGGNEINIYNTVQGDISISGLVLSRAHAHVPPLTLHRPNINVKNAGGDIIINGNTVEPLYDEYNYRGTKYDLWGGLLSWVTNNVNPGTVKVQASGDVTVNGHGADPTGPVRKSFGAVAAVATASSAPGGVVNVVALNGNIVGNDRAFDVSGRNRLSTNFAHIYLFAKNDITTSRLGANDTFNPVVNASSPSVGDKGGTNELQSFAGNIVNNVNALISAAVPAGSGSVQGVNMLTYAGTLTNNGTITPAPVTSNVGAAGPTPIL